MQLAVIKALDLRGFRVYLHKREDGKEFIAEISNEAINWKVIDHSRDVPATFVVKNFESEGIDIKHWEDRYEEMKDAKNDHLDNLNIIIDKLLAKA